MAKLFFRYGAMNSGKSTQLLQVAHNYEERGMRALLLKPGIDTKGGVTIVSRLGASKAADAVITPQTNCYELLCRMKAKQVLFHCVLVDEAQFLSSEQVDQLFLFVLDDNIPCICYGLRTDFRGQGFPGSTRLLELAHSIEETKTICRCGHKAIMNLRRINGIPVFEGDQIAIDDQDTVEYEALCGQCYMREKRKAESQSDL